MAVEDGSAGCEFLDDGGYGKVPPASLSRQSFWMVPTEIVAQVANPARLEDVRRETAYIHELEISISKHGVIHPLEMHFDPSGSIYLKDGHHRLAASLLLGLKSIPVFVIEDKVKVTKGSRVMMLPAGFRIEQWMDLICYAKKGRT